MENPGASFELKAIAVEYGSLRALGGVDLHIGAGEAVAFVGPSGAGKTTLLRLLNGSSRPSHGSVVADGRTLAHLSRRELRRLRSRIGFVHQDLRLVPNIRVLKNVIAGRLGRLSIVSSLRAMLLPSRSTVHEVYEILRRVGIPEKLYHRTDSLSGGQRQRVAVARALFQEPVAILADEPVSSLDPARARDTLTLLTELSEERHLTLCASLHDLELAREFFPRLVGLRHGQVVFDRPPRDIEEEEFQALYELAPEEMLRDAS